MNYEEVEGVNWSSLKNMHPSPKNMQSFLRSKRRDTAQMALGRAVHCALLEPERFELNFCVKPKFDLRRNGEREALAKWEEEHSESEHITQAQLETAFRCREAIANHEIASFFIPGDDPERAIFWEDELTGLKCKARVDTLKGGVVDLKTTTQENLAAILRDAARRMYHGQSAWYHHAAVEDGLIDGSRLPVNVFVQTVEPFDVAVLRMTEETFEEGTLLWRSLLDQYAGCLKMDWWPGMAEEDVPWTLPRWAKMERC